MAVLEAITGGLGALASGVGSIFGFEAVEEPRYEVLLRQDAFEVRCYEAYALATTAVPGGFREGSTEGFRRLARYIFGGNQGARGLEMTAPVVREKQGEALAMTAPVLREPAGEAMAMTAPVLRGRPAETARGWTMSFVLPAGIRRANAPVPLDDRVVVTDVPAQDVACVRFSGLGTEADFTREEARLRTWLTPATGWEPSGGARWAAYNPPFTLPFCRRNEVLVPVRRSAAASDG